VIATSAYENLPRPTRRRLLRRALVRPSLCAIAWFVLYFTLPLDRPFTALTIVALLAGLCAFAGLIVYQVRLIVRSPYPRLAAITALAVSVPLFVLSFASVYFLMEHSASSSFTEPLTRLDALYFTVTVLSTVGFGDIAAVSEVARAVTTVQMVGDLVLIGLVARVLLNAVQTGLASRSTTSANGPPADSTDS
jgi:voltage-gated potassium channel